MKLKSVLSALGMAALTWQASAAPSVEINNVQQQYPWTNVVDIAYTVSGITNAEYFAVFEAKEGNTLLGAVTNELDGTGKKASDQITLATTWEPDFNWQKTGVTMTPYIYRGGVGAGDDYLIIDLETWKVTYEGMVTQEDSNKKYNTDEYKTKKMVFRKIPKGWPVYLNKTNTGYTVPSDYYIGVFEVTAAQYAYINSGSLSGVAAADYKKPQLNLNWNTVRGSAGPTATVTTGPLASLNSKVKAAGTTIYADLPTAQMWEVACRGETALTTTYYWGDDTTNAKNYANYRGAYSNTIREVGTLLPNDIGLYDPLGNAWEWVRDAAASSGSAYFFTANSSGTNRAQMGGACGDSGYYCAYLLTRAASLAAADFGFRIAIYP